MIVLVRHPAVQAGGRCYGRTELTVAAEAAAGLAGLLAGLPGRVWTSPAQRCRAVAEALGSHRVDERLQELDFGAWEGVPWAQVPRDSLDAWAADPAGFAPPGGESGAALLARVDAFWRSLPAEDHVVISHGGPLRLLIRLAQGRAPDLLAPPPPPGFITLLPTA